MRPENARRLPESGSPLQVALVLLAVEFVLFGGHLRDGYLSDDFLFVSWARESAATLLAHLSIASYPQVIRPLPALFWLAGRLAWGAALLHALSLALHGANSALLYTISRRWGAPASTAFLLAFLFLAFPLSGEAVLWLSANVDLWATLFALLAVAAVQRSRFWPGVLFYALALLCKESAICLPLALLLLFPRLWRRISTFFLVTLGYLAVRFALFGGIGGYRDAMGHPVATQLHPGAVMRALLLQVPARVLAPVPVESRLAMGVLIVLSAALLGVFLLSGFRPRKASLAGAGVFLAAILPAATMLRVEWDLQGARLLYLPLALALAALARFARPSPMAARAAGTLLAAGWLAAALLNGGHWSGAGRAVDATLSAMRELQARYPPGATVLVDALDTYKGAYVFRNGLPEAAALAGLRRDLVWRRGTAALLGSGRDLGTSVFEIGSVDGRPVDWTDCEKSLFAAPPSGPPLPLVGPVPSPAGECVAVTLATTCPSPEPLTGKLFWKTSERAPFTSMESREFKISTEPLPVRLPRLAGPALWLRIDLDRPMPADCREGAGLTATVRRPAGAAPKPPRTAGRTSS